MKARLLLGLMLATLLAVSVAGQDPARATDPVSRAREALLERRGDLGLQPDLADLRPSSVRSGLAGDYVRFQQTIGGIPLHGAQIVVGLAEDGHEAVNSRYRPGVAPQQAGERLPEQAAVSAALAALEANQSDLRGDVRAEQTYVTLDGETLLVWRVFLPLSEPFGSWLVTVSMDGDVLYMVDTLRYDSGQVFDPNPPYHSEGTIPPPVDCDSALNEPDLSTQYFTRALQGILGGQDKLKGEYVDLTAPGIMGAYKAAGQANEPTRVYSYLCTDDRFEEVMTYYHVDATQRKLQALGFSGAAAILDYPVPAHAHYFAECNAFFDPVVEGLHFGDGGPCGYFADAAEDADVIVHEYGHAIQHDQVPGWGFGATYAEVEQAWSMGEGFSDFLTAAMFGDPCLAEWFSFGGSCLRNIDNTNQYPGDFEDCRLSAPDPPVVEPHCGGLIWGGALWDLAQAFGGDQAALDKALTLVLESHFLVSPVPTFDEAASAVRLADSLLFGGANGLTIDSVFAGRGISTMTAVEDFNYVYVRINHPDRNELDVDLLVGNEISPVCALSLWPPFPLPPSGPDLVGYWVLDFEGNPCLQYLPPTAGQPWYLRVGDVESGGTGTLNRYEMVMDGSLRCYAADVPIAIPDNGAPVFSAVDCSSSVNGDLSDEDGDGFDAAVELHVGTGAQVPCGADGWPADLYPDGLSANKLDLLDLTSFLAPVRIIGTSPGDPDFDQRWDLAPGAGLLGSTINIQDLTALVTLYPPMLGGERAFNQICPS